MPDVSAHHDLLDRLTTDPARWDGPRRVAALAEVEQLRQWLVGREATLLAAVHRERDDVNAGARELAQLVQHQAHVGFGEAKRRELRAMWLARLPVALATLTAGGLGIEQADALCLLADRLDPDERPALSAAEHGLVCELVEMTPPAAKKRLLQFEHDLADDDGARRLDKQRRANALRLPKNADGTVGIHGQLDPIAGAELRAAIDAKVSEIWRREHRSAGADVAPPEAVITNDRRRAEALMELVREARNGRSSNSGSAGAQLLVLIDYQTLLGQLATAGIMCRLGDGTPIPASEARRLACEAGIIPAVLGSPSQPLDVGRDSRLATPAQRAALRSIHDTCVVDGCDVPFEFCDLHHLHEWANDGHTDLDNLTPVCSKHHHLAHSTHWRLEIGADRTGSLVAVAAVDSRHQTTREGSSSECTPSRGGKAGSPARARAGMPVPSRCDLDPDRRPHPDDALIPMRC